MMKSSKNKAFEVKESSNHFFLQRRLKVSTTFNRQNNFKNQTFQPFNDSTSPCGDNRCIKKTHKNDNYHRQQILVEAKLEIFTPIWEKL